MTFKPDRNEPKPPPILYDERGRPTKPVMRIRRRQIATVILFYLCAGAALYWIWQ